MKAEAGDPFAWLRRREDPRVLDFLRRENEHTERETGPLRALEDRIYAEIRGRIQEDDRSVPAPHGEYLYYHRTESGKPYRILARAPAGTDFRDGIPTDEQVVLDENALAAPHDFFHVGGYAISPDHRYVAYAYDTTGDEAFAVVVDDVAAGRRLPERMTRTAEELAWSADSRTLFYVTRDALMRSYRVYRHRLGFDPADDALVFEEKDEAFHIGLRSSRSGRYVFIETSSAVTRETLMIDAARPEAPPISVGGRERGVEVCVADPGGEALWVLTNRDAVNFELLEAPVSEGEIVGTPGTWAKVVPHRDDVMLEGIEVFERFAVLVVREGGERHLDVLESDGTHWRVGVEGTVRSIDVGDNREFAAGAFRYSVSSLSRPRTDFEVDISSRRVTELKQEPAPGVDPSRYRTERIWATADDDVRIPISIVRRADLDLDGRAPCLLSGYGSYGICFDPAYSNPALSLVDRGFVFAIAHVRGGGELGERWHEHGKMAHKRNTFTDFIRCAETLIEEGYTAADRLGIQGRSAGGLLMGAVTNMRPDLFRAVVAGVPFVDVLATMLDPSIPLTVIEYEEWGDPRDPEYYDYIRSYSPFDNVREAEYPHMLVTAGLNDPRVQFWEPARWVARLRERRTDDRRLLLKTDMGAGHRGPSDRFAWLRDKAFEYAFLVSALAPELVGDAALEGTAG